MSAIEVLAEQPAGEPYAAFPHVAEIIVGLIAFSLLVYVIGKFAWPNVVTSHEDTKKQIEGGIAKAEAMEADAKAELARSRERLAGVDDETARIRDDARADAERIGQDMDAKAAEEAERVRAQGRQSLEASRSRAIAELRAQTGRESVELSRRIVASALSDDASRGASVDRFLDELEAMGGAAGGSNDPDASVISGNGAGA
ncbi:ATP synthase F0 subcomplex B subunit [Actinomycetospora succinea]|uniref:ATP synthase subunit b n=1 Tax=Actinomycetospora succinea TaxID=663603 RepID=A0A4R6VN27_9PSEU|nr:F0F1 ATP synthase subunit B [Actinomycetospora succinea]TDQ65229.1 ATP synthase F0 subcomplex B subunit [Actinomycetospora succinea]